jgi:hypothetical protein
MRDGCHRFICGVENIPSAFSACSIVFLAMSRNSAGNSCPRSSAPFALAGLVQLAMAALLALRAQAK